LVLHKVGVVGLFKGERLREQRIYIERYDEVRGEMLIRVLLGHF